jgi:hypothetical protein
MADEFAPTRHLEKRGKIRMKESNPWPEKLSSRSWNVERNEKPVARRNARRILGGQKRCMLRDWHTRCEPNPHPHILHRQGKKARIQVAFMSVAQVGFIGIGENFFTLRQCQRINGSCTMPRGSER